MRRLLTCLLCGLLALSASAAAWSPQPLPGEDPRVLVLGAVSDDPATDYDRLKPLLDYAVARLSGVGIREGRILMARDARQMASYLRRGRVDWVTASAATGMRLQTEAGAQPLLVDERTGASRSRTVIFVRRDSNLRRLDELRGRSIAFAGGASAGAYYMPASQLLELHLPMQLLASPLDRPSGDAVGYVFARAQANIAAWVHRGLVDAGTASDSDWQNPQSMPPAFREEFVVIATSPEYPSAVEMVRGDLAPAVRDRLREVLLRTGDDPDAREPLLEFARTTRFLPLDAESGALLERMRDGVARVRAALE